VEAVGKYRAALAKKQEQIGELRAKVQIAHQYVRASVQVHGFWCIPSQLFFQHEKYDETFTIRNRN
jgi:hypothetical protein